MNRMVCAQMPKSASTKKQNKFYKTLIHALAGNKLHSTSSHTLYTPNTFTMRFQFCCECKATYKCYKCELVDQWYIAVHCGSNQEKKKENLSNTAAILSSAVNR